MKTCYMTSPKRKLIVILLHVLVFFTLDAQAVSTHKWHPGNYISLYPNELEPAYFNGVLKDLSAHPKFQGVHKQYFWNKLEPTYGVYDFSEIVSDVQKLAKIGKRLVIRIEAESFQGKQIYVPSYLLTAAYEGGVYPIYAGNGYNVAYYNVNVQNRLIALVKALGSKFDTNPNVEAVTFEETAPSTWETTFQKLYQDDYVAGMLRVAVAAKAAFPHTVVIQNVNFPLASLPLIFDTLKSNGVGIGGPDTLEHDASLVNGSYFYQSQVVGNLPVGMSVDYSDYETSTGSLSKLDYPSVSSIYEFNANNLKSNYIFWLRRTKESNGSDYWLDVLDFFATLPSTSSLSSSCPAAINPCN